MFRYIHTFNFSPNKNWFRYISLVMALLLQCMLLVGVLLATRHNTERVLKSHSEEIMTHIVASVANQTKAMLEPAERAVALTGDLLQSGQIEAQDDSKLEGYFLSQLQTNENLAGMYLGRADGSFVYVKRVLADTTLSKNDNQDTTSGFITKIIHTQPERQVELLHRDSDSKFTHRQSTPEDAYDPRERPWYTQAHTSVSSQAIWTKPYVFFSSLKPGLTTAKEIFADDGRSLGIVGVDIEISQLSTYLENTVQDNSYAFIQTHDGVAVAFPRSNSKNHSEAQFDRQNPSLPKIQDLKDSAITSFLSAANLTAANLSAVPVSTSSVNPFNDLQQDLSEQKQLEFQSNNTTYVGMLEPISFVKGQTWLLGLYAPEDVYLQSLQSQFKRSSWHIFLIGLLCSLLAIPLSFGISQPLRRLYRNATTDSLTGLLNRNEFLKQAERITKRAKRTHKKVGFIMLDLDKFKPINDNHGHGIGDEVLVAVAGRLKKVIKSDDAIGRLGGDEFAIALYNIDNDETLLSVTERIRQTLSGRQIATSGGNFEIGATAGAVVSQRGQSVEEALSLADDALIHGKVEQKGKSYISDGNFLDKIIQQPTQMAVVDFDIQPNFDVEELGTVASQNYN